MGGLNGLDYTLESRLKGLIAANVSRENVPEYLFKFADNEASSDFVAVIRRLPHDFRIAENGKGNAKRDIQFREYGDPYTDRGTLWVRVGRSSIAFFYLTPYALGLSKDKLLEILNQAEKSVEAVMVELSKIVPFSPKGNKRFLAG